MEAAKKRAAKKPTAKKKAAKKKPAAKKKAKKKAAKKKPKKKAAKKKATKKTKSGAFARLSPEELAKRRKGTTHLMGKYRCKTDTRGYATPDDRPPASLVVDATEGFIPLWKKGVTLRWRFQKQSLEQFVDPEAAKDAIRALLGDALLLWGDFVPVKFAERNDAWDFEVVAAEFNDCDSSGCVLASAFFPDQGRHELVIYPMTFDEPEEEQVETMAHELGHVFGLRHFFAQVSEAAWASEIFGDHSPFSIMNYGVQSKMTDADREDLRTLYDLVWSGELTEINGTDIKLVKPWHLAD